MNHRRLLIAGLLCARVGLAVEPAARLEGGALIPLSEPQRTYFGPGVQVSGVGSLEVLELLDVELGFAWSLLPAAPTSSQPTGTAFGLAAGARLKRPMRDALLVPWLALHLGWTYSALSSVALEPSVGLAIRPSARSPVWFGPFVRFTQYLALGELPGYQTFNASLLTVGISVELAQRAPPEPPPPPVTPPPPPAPPPMAPEPPPPPRDTDGDGIPDADDDCPRKPGDRANGGCPTYAQVVVTERKLELKQKIFFAFGTTTILPKSDPLLSDVAQALQDHEALCVRIEGHTDSVGNYDANLKLSHGRAAAVREFLLTHGVAPARLVSRGYGSSLPVDNNATLEGRENNRRVEFVIISCGTEPQ